MLCYSLSVVHLKDKYVTSFTVLVEERDTKGEKKKKVRKGVKKITYLRNYLPPNLRGLFKQYPI
jgi:hypothetical protein